MHVMNLKKNLDFCKAIILQLKKQEKTKQPGLLSQTF